MSDDTEALRRRVREAVARIEANVAKVEAIAAEIRAARLPSDPGTR